MNKKYKMLAVAAGVCMLLTIQVIVLYLWFDFAGRQPQPYQGIMTILGIGWIATLLVVGLIAASD